MLLRREALRLIGLLFITSGFCKGQTDDETAQEVEDTETLEVGSFGCAMYGPAHYRGCPNVPVISRAAWKAKKPKHVEKLRVPVPNVIIHHTYEPRAVFTTERCKEAMRSIQNFHQNDRKWDDIGYNFAICGDGNVYEGRGWNRVGAHAKGQNSHSIGIVFIGDYRDVLPSTKMLERAKELIACGVKKKIINPNYALKGHRDVGTTECPGNKLYDNIKSWPHFYNALKSE